uniref:Uncharacterized protein n=1 Tax=Arundo donax TaxID=35708 RepID=A0A0A8Z3R6_ARUDO
MEFSFCLFGAITFDMAPF